MKTTVNHLDYQSADYTIWFASNYENLVKLLSPCNLDILHDTFFSCQNTQVMFLQNTVETYQRLLQQEQNRSYQTFNPDPLFWQYQAETVSDDEEPDRDYERMYRRLMDIMHLKLSPQEREILLMKVSMRASTHDIAEVMGMDKSAVERVLRRVKTILNENFQKITL